MTNLIHEGSLRCPVCHEPCSYSDIQIIEEFNIPGTKNSSTISINVAETLAQELSANLKFNYKSPDIKKFFFPPS